MSILFVSEQISEQILSQMLPAARAAARAAGLVLSYGQKLRQQVKMILLGFRIALFIRWPAEETRLARLV